MTTDRRREEEFTALVRRAAVLASALPADYAEIRLSEGESTVISLAAGNVEAASMGDGRSGSVRVLKNGAWGFVSFTDPGAMEACATRAVELAEGIIPPIPSAVTRGAPITGVYHTESARDFLEVSFDEKFSLMRSYDAILSAPAAVQTTRVTYRDQQSWYGYANSEGTALAYDRRYCGMALAAVARDGAVIQPYHESVSGYGGYEIVTGQEEAAESVARVAVDLLAAGKVPGGRCTVVADQHLAGVFIHEAFGHLSEADFIHENPSLQRLMTLGRRVGPPVLTACDDGTMAGHSGFIPFDDEGTTPGKTVLIDRGVLSGRLHSRETAAKMGEAPTGNARAIGAMRQPLVRMTCTYIENGTTTRDEMMAAADDGIYARGNIGGQTNLEMFTFTAAYGYEIKKGKIGRMYRDVVLSGNVFQTLDNIALVGDDRRMFGGLGGCGKGGQSPLPVSLGSPHIMVTGVLIGGKR